MVALCQGIGQKRIFFSPELHCVLILSTESTTKLSKNVLWVLSLSNISFSLGDDEWKKENFSHNQIAFWGDFFKSLFRQKIGDFHEN
jgi:hypothetical protein